MTTIEERLDQDFERIDERLGKLETDATANAVVQRQLTESIEALTKKVDAGLARIETRLETIEEHVLELPTLKEIAGTVRHIVEESRS